tara:strand:- start:92 stop:283 length:192 start_codon:yes stop_codon:yes gene_type:complete
MDIFVADHFSLGDLIAKICTQLPNITTDPATIVAAVNEEYRNHEHHLRNNDEVALIPPVSGGV